MDEFGVPPILGKPQYTEHYRTNWLNLLWYPHLPLSPNAPHLHQLAISVDLES